MSENSNIAPKDPTVATRRNSRYYTQIDPIMTDPVIRGYFTLVASFALTAFFIFFALSPTFSTIVGLVRKIDDQKKTVTMLDSKISNLIAAQENYSQVESRLPLLETALPTKPLPENVFEEIVKSGSASGVKITALQINEVYLTGINPKKTGDVVPGVDEPVSQGFFATLGLPTVSYSLGVTGTKGEIRAFVGYIVNLPRILMLEEFSISNQTNKLDPGEDMTSEISGSAFYYPEVKVRKIDPAPKL